MNVKMMNIAIGTIFACFRLANGDRPFDYFQPQQQIRYLESENPEGFELLEILMKHDAHILKFKMQFFPVWFYFFSN